MKKIVITAISVITLVVPAVASAHTWKTIDSDSDYGSGFSIVSADAWTGASHHTRNGHARGMRVLVKGKPGTRVSVHVNLECVDYDPHWKYDVLYRERVHWDWSFTATSNPSKRVLRVYTSDPPWLTWWESCEASVEAYTRDSGPLIAKIQKRVD